MLDIKIYECLKSNQILKNKSLEIINKEGIEPSYFLSNQEQINFIINEIIKTASKELVATKIPTPTNEERNNKEFKDTNCPSNSSQGF